MEQVFIQKLSRRASLLQSHSPTTFRYPPDTTDTESAASASNEGEAYVYFAVGTTVHQDLYPRKHKRLVSSRPPRKDRRTSEWSGVYNPEETVAFSEQQQLADALELGPADSTSAESTSV